MSAQSYAAIAAGDGPEGPAMNGTMGAGEQGQSSGPRVGSEISSMSFEGAMAQYK